MTRAKLEIVVDALNMATDDLRAVTRELGALKEQADTGAQAVGGMSLKWTEFASMLAVARTALDGLKMAFDFAAEGAALARLEEAGANLAASMGGSYEEIIQAVQEASGFTVSESEAMLMANRAMRLEVARTPEEFRRLVAAASALGRTMGLTTSEAVEFAITGIGRVSPQILDNIGYVADAEVVYAEYAKQIGKTTEELTGAEKKQAILNDLLKKAAPLLDEVGNAAADAASEYERLGAATGTAAERLKKELGEALAPVAGWLADLVERHNDVSEAMDLLGARIVRGGLYISATGEIIATSADELLRLAESMRNAAETHDYLKPRAEDLAVTLERESEAANALTQELEAVPEEIEVRLNVRAESAFERAMQELQWLKAGGQPINVVTSILPQIDYTRVPARLLEKMFAEGEAWSMIIKADIEGLSERELRQLKADIAEATQLDPEVIAQMFADYEERGVQAVKGWAKVQLETIGTFQPELKKALEPLRTEIDYFRTQWEALDGSRITLGVDIVGAGLPIARRASGGPLAPITEVGEQGPELIINGVVIDAETTRRLKRLGLRPTQQRWAGGLIDRWVYIDGYGVPFGAGRYYEPAPTSAASAARRVTPQRVTRTLAATREEAQAAPPPPQPSAEDAMRDVAQIAGEVAQETAQAAAGEVAQETAQAAAGAAARASTEQASLLVAIQAQQMRTQIAAQTRASQAMIERLDAIHQALLRLGTADDIAKAVAEAMQYYQGE